jgi:hypothetical protein
MIKNIIRIVLGIAGLGALLLDMGCAVSQISASLHPDTVIARYDFNDTIIVSIALVDTTERLSADFTADSALYAIRVPDGWYVSGVDYVFASSMNADSLNDSVMNVLLLSKQAGVRRADLDDSVTYMTTNPSLPGSWMAWATHPAINIPQGTLMDTIYPDTTVADSVAMKTMGIIFVAHIRSGASNGTYYFEHYFSADNIISADSSQTKTEDKMARDTIIVGTVALEKTSLSSGLPVLGENYPNPFNAITHIPLNLSQVREPGQLTIYNPAGRQVAQYSINRGQPSLAWNGRDASSRLLPNGVYFYELKAGKTKISKRMQLMR